MVCAWAWRWVDTLEATGGTNINDALAASLDMRTSDPARTFTIVFFTDGQPTIGETNTDKILQNVTKRNTASTRCIHSVGAAEIHGTGCGHGRRHGGDGQPERRGMGEKAMTHAAQRLRPR